MLATARLDVCTPEEPKPLEVRAPDMGVVAFDNPKEPAAGWACAAGNSDPVRVRDPSDLATSTMWLTNASVRQNNLRNANYLCTSIGDIAQDLGHRLIGHHCVDALPVLAEVSQRVAHLAVKHYQWFEPGAFTGYSLAADLRLAMPVDVSPNPAISTPLREAYQNNSAGFQRVFASPSREVVVRVNRLIHAYHILALPIPDPAWYPVRNLPLSAHERLDLALDVRYPSLCEVTCAAEDLDLWRLASFGNQMGKNSRLVRRWVAQPELLWLAHYSEIDVHTVWRSAGYVAADPRFLLPKTLTADGYQALSYSAGLLAESHFAAVASNAPPSLRTPPYTERAVWWRAYDRAQSFALARDIHEAGFLPTGYWRGSVRVQVDNHKMLDFARWALERGLAAPNQVLLKTLFEEIEAERA